MSDKENKPLIKQATPAFSEEKDPVKHFSESLKLLYNSEKSLIYMFIINYLLRLQYYILVTFIPLYFTTEHNFSDFLSGLIFGCFGIVMGLSSIYLSNILHIINCKRGLLVSSFLGIIGFVLMMLNNKYLSLVAVVTAQSISCSLSWPFIEYGIKEYSSAEIRNISSSCYFMSNYSAGITVGVFIDYLWNSMDDKNSMYLIVYGIGIIALIISAGFVMACRNIKNSLHRDSETQGIFSQKRF